MNAHDPPLLERLRRIDRRLLVLNRRVRTLLAERDALVARLRTTPAPSPAPEPTAAPAPHAMPDASETHEMSEAPEARAAYAARDAHSVQVARDAQDTHGAHDVSEVHEAGATHGVQGADEAYASHETHEAQSSRAAREGNEVPGRAAAPEAPVVPEGFEAGARAAAPRRPDAHASEAARVVAAWAPEAHGGPGAHGTHEVPQAHAAHVTGETGDTHDAPGAYAAQRGPAPQVPEAGQVVHPARDMHEAAHEHEGLSQPDMRDAQSARVARVVPETHGHADVRWGHGATGAPVPSGGSREQGARIAREALAADGAQGPHEANEAQATQGAQSARVARDVTPSSAPPASSAREEVERSSQGVRPQQDVQAGSAAHGDRAMHTIHDPHGAHNEYEAHAAHAEPGARTAQNARGTQVARDARWAHGARAADAAQSGRGRENARGAGAGIGTVPEIRRHSARNAILGLGAALMSVAALVFAVWAWTAADTGTRALMLLSVTAGVAWLAVPLHRRGLGATAQALGALLVVLLGVDAFLLWVLLGHGVDPAGYAAGATAVVAALLALHGRYVPLHANAPVAVVLAQPVPVLIVVSASPGTGSWVWLLAVVAATALADALVLRVCTPVGLRTSAGVMTALALGALVFAVPGATTPDAWWAIAAVLLLAGSAGLVQARGEIREAVSVASVLLLALAPLAASRTASVLFPGPLAWWWADDLQLLGVPATEMLRAGTETPAAGPLALGPALAAALLGAVVVRLLAPQYLVPHLSVALPLTVLPATLLLGASHAGLVATALVLGTAMLLASRRIPGHSPWTLAIGGCATLALGLWWSTAVQHSLVATLVLFAVFALVCLHLRPRTDTPRPTEPVPSAQGRGSGGAPEGKSASGATVAATLRSCALALWILTMVAGTVHVMVLAATLQVGPQEPSAPWWAAALITLLCAAFGLTWGGAARPAGIVLMPVAVLVAGPALAPLARLVPEAGRGAPTLWQPAHTVLDTSVSGGAATAVAVLVAGAAAVALTWWLDRAWWPLVTSFVAPLALLPVPIVIGAPFAPTVVLALAVGAGLLAFAVVAGDRTEARWVPVLVGTVVLLWALAWSLASVYTSVPTLAALAVGALVLLRRGVPRAESLARNAAAVTAGVPAWAAAARAAPIRAVARALPASAIALWATVLVVGAVHLALLAFTRDPAVGWWWAAALVTLVCAAVGLSLGRTLRWTGVVLMPVTVLVAGPALGPWLRPGPGVHGLWGAPDAALWQPAHVVLGTSTSEGVLTAVAVLVAGAAALAVTWRLDRARLLLVASLVAPVALVPLPVVLGTPFAVSVLWTLAVGAGLLAVPVLRGIPVLRDRIPDRHVQESTGPALSGAGWIPVLTGSLVLLWALGWSSVSVYTTALTLLVFAGLALTVLLLAVPRVADPVAARALRWTSAGLWGTAIVIGTVHLSAFAALTGGPLGLWWVAALTALVCAAFGLAWGDVLRAVGVVLMPVTVLLAGPALSPLLTFGPAAHGPWGSPDAALWQPAHAVLGTSTSEGVLTAVGVLVAGAAALAVTWRLDRARLLVVGSLVAPVALIPVPVVLELPFLAALLLTLAVGAALTTVAALRREHTADLWLPGLLGAAVLVWAFMWALASDVSTVVALLAVAVAGATAAALAQTSAIAVIATAVATGATGGSTLVVPLTLGMPVEHAALLPIALTAAVAAVAPRLRSPLTEAAEVPASLWAVAALVLAIVFGVRGELVALGLACLGVVSLCTALRPDRRPLAFGGTALMFAALWTALASWDVTVPEAYTAPPALAAVAVGWEWSRRAGRGAAPSSWLAHSGGLLLLLGPSTVLAVVEEEPVLRILAVVAVGLAVTLWGLRSRLRAPLVIGGGALLVVSVRAFGPPFMDLLVELPNWLPFAAVGAVLLTVGARYEASLRGLRTLRRAYSEMQ